MRMRLQLNVVLALSVLLASMLLAGSAPLGEDLVDSSAGEGLSIAAQLGGAIRPVALAGDLAYVGVGPSVHVIDISDPTRPWLLGRTSALPSAVNDVTVNGSAIYVLSGTGIHVFDATNPMSPHAGIVLETDETANALAVEGATLCVVDRHNLYILDASIPSLPTKVGRIRVGSFAEAVGVAISGNHAYVANAVEGLRIIDISSPATPELSGTFDVADDVRDVAILGKRAFLADAIGLQVVDITDPAKPLRIGGLTTPGTATAVAITVQRAYVADGLGGLQILDITNPGSPSLLAGLDLPGISEWVAATDDQAFVANSSALHVVDVSTPEEPANVGAYATSIEAASSVALSGGLAYVTSGPGGLYVVDVMTATAPIVLGNVGGMEDAAFVAVEGSYAYVAASFDGLQVVDVSDPTIPVARGSWPTSGEAESTGVAVQNSVAYVANQPDWGADEPEGGGLRIVDVANPDDPREIGFLDTRDEAWAVAVAGDYAYLGVSWYDEGQGETVGGLSVINVAVPAQPAEVGFLLVPDEARALALRGSLLYVGTPSGTHVVDVSNPADPRMRGAASESAYGIAVEGSYAFLASHDLTVLDVSNPDALEEYGRLATAGAAVGVAAGDGYAFVADGEGGLVIVEVAQPEEPSRVYLPLGMRNRQ